MLNIREAVDADVEQIRDVFYAAYGADYAYPQYYDPAMLKKFVYADDTLLLVAEDSDTGRVLGTASVVMHVGAYADLVGEFGRLVVHPDARGQGIGNRLMEARLAHVGDQIHVGLVENRAVHAFSQKISTKFGFAPVGFLPMKLLVTERESISLFVKYFGPALELRRNNPRVIPEAYPIAEMALDNCGLPGDAIVDEQSLAYPLVEDYELGELTTEGYSSLLRFERGRVKNREIFGPMRLHYGLFKLRASHSYYLLAKEQGQIVGAVGFVVDDVEHTARIFELVSVGESPIRFLLNQFIDQVPERWNVEYVEVDVTAYAPRMQRTLLEVGFLPVAYVPAMVFHDVERLDIVKMARTLVPLDFRDVQLHEASRTFGELVIHNLTSREVLPRIADAIPGIALFAGLSDEQVTRLAGECEFRAFNAGDVLFAEGTEDDEFYLILTGDVAITRESRDCPVGTVGTGEALGEMSLVTCSTHSATATATAPVDTAVLSRERLLELIRRRPDIGVVVYRNLAAGLSNKLRRALAALDVITPDHCGIESTRSCTSFLSTSCVVTISTGWRPGWLLSLR